MYTSTGEVKEITGHASHLANMIINHLEKIGGEASLFTILGDRFEIIEGQYNGNYYYEKKDISGQQSIIIGNNVGAVKFSVKDFEVHIDTLEINPEFRGKGICTHILNIFKTMSMVTNYRVTLRVEPIDLHISMGKVAAKKYGPKLYKRYRTAIDKRIERLCKFYFENGFTPTPGTGICWEYKGQISPDLLKQFKTTTTENLQHIL